MPITFSLRAACRSRTATALVLVTLTFFVTASAEEGHDHDEHEGHDHSHEQVRPASQPGPVEAHDHAGHGHGEEHDDAHGHEEHADEVTLTAEAIQRHRIQVEPVKRHALAATLVAPARVAFNAEAMAHVGSAVRGRIAELKARVGDTVHKGDVLLVIDSPELGEAQSDFLQKRAAAAAAAPGVALARSAYERGRALLDESQGISLTEVQKREMEYRAAEAALQAARAAAVAAENRLHLLGADQAALEELARSGKVVPRYAVVAPIAGAVIEREVTLGELVSLEREHLLILADMSTLWVQADVPEARLRGVAKGSPARVTLAALPGDAIRGSVAFVAPTVDASTRSVKVRIEVENKDGALKPGMFARAEIAAGAPTEQEAALAVPESAVLTVEGGPAVFVAVEGEPNTFARRAVAVGKPVAGMLPVTSGLKEGEQVVTGGAFILKAELGKAGAAHEH